jgi:RimJ/RimL family protein N-acetyltransferase
MYEHKNGLVLRKIEERDLKLLKKLKDESWFGTHSVSILNMSDQIDWFNKIMLDKNTLILIAEEGEKSIGVYKITKIDWVNRSYDSGHDVFKLERGKGYGYKVLEAGVDFGFEVLNMHRVDTEVLSNNIASQKAILFGGLKQGGVRKEAVHKCGEWIDSILYGLLYEDWINLDRVKQHGGCCNLSYIPKDKK